MKRAVANIALLWAAALCACAGHSAPRQDRRPLAVTTEPHAADAGSMAPPVAHAPRAPLVMWAQDDAAPMVAIRAVFRAGSVDDPPGREGLTALTASLMAEATTALDATALEKAWFPTATGIRVHVDRETTTFALRVHPEVAPRAVALLMDVLARPRMSGADFERVRQDAVSFVTYGLRQSDDEALGFATLDGYMYAGHPYAHPAEGTVAALRAASLSEVEAHRARVFTGARLLLGAGGPLSAVVKQALADGLARLPPGATAAPPTVPPPPPLTGRHVVIVRKPAQSTPITMGFHHAVGRNHPDFAALLLATSALGEHRNQAGRLFQRMRELRGLNYGDYAYMEHFVEDPGDAPLPRLGIFSSLPSFVLWVRPVELADRVFALRLALMELEAFVAKGITAEELEQTRRFLMGATWLWTEGMDRRVGWMLDDVLHGTPDFVPTLRARLGQLTLAQVNAVVARHLSADNLLITLAADDAEALGALLLAGTPTPRPAAKTANLPADLQQQDAVVAAHPLRLAPGSVMVVDVDALF